MKRLLCIIGGMNAGGAETFLMKIYRSIDKTNYQLDFAVSTKEKGFYDEEINKFGGKIYHIAPKSSNPFSNFSAIKSIVKKNHYRSVLRISQHSLSALELLAAKFGGAKIRGFRSSNSDTVSGTKKARLLHKLFLFMPKHFANVKIAPSSEAAKFMFGKNSLKKKNVYILKNGIDFSQYCYNEKERRRIRDELKLNDCFVVGHIGRFNQQKNHPFLIEIFSEIKKIEKTAKLLLVGMGEKEKEIKSIVKSKGLSDSVIFCGVRSDIPSILNAIDVFVFPSLYEGMPNTVIEAQACGIPCLISDTITKEVKFSNLLSFLPLTLSAKTWAENALSYKNSKQAIFDIDEKNKYDVNVSSKIFVDLFFKN